MAIVAMVRKVMTARGIILVPDSILDAEAIARMKDGKVGKATIVIPRNGKFHRKGFALISVVFDCMSEERKKELNVWTAEELRTRIKIDLGLYTMFIVGADSTLPEGTVVYKPDSMSYDEMDDDSFETLYNQIIMISISKYISGQDEESINAMVDEILRFGEQR